MFQDRKEAGALLAAEIERLLAEDPAAPPPVVLALPRGGVPVGFEIARRLDAPLDLVLVRKVGVPGQPELAAGAVVNGDDPVFVENREVIAMAGLSEAEIEAIKRRELAEIERRRDIYLGGRDRAPLDGATIIVVDDGIATGATARAALRSLRRRRPARLILAIPVAAEDTIEQLRNDVDRVVCLKPSRHLVAVGAHYAEFGQTPDDEIVRLLALAAKFGASQGGGPID